MHPRFRFTLLALALASCSGSPAPEQPPAKSNPQAGEALSLTEVADEYEAVGTVRSKTRSILSSRVVGNVLSVPVREGDTVEAGQLLMEIDDRDARASQRKAQAGLREAEDSLEEVGHSIAAARSGLDAAQANVQLATLNFNRQKTMLERKTVSQQDFDEAQAKFKAATADAVRAQQMVEASLSRQKQVEARIEQAKADVANAELQVGYSRITAPAAGIVTARPADIGFLAAPGVPLITIEDHASYRFEAAVEESRISLVRLGTPAKVSIDALPGVEFEGRVAEIVPTSDEASRSLIVKIDLVMPSRPGAEPPPLRSGFFGRARFPLGTRKALLIPQSAVLRQGQLLSVRIVKPDATTDFRLIRTGRPYGDQVEVISGLEPGEQLRRQLP